MSTGFRLPDVHRGPRVRLFCDGEVVECHAGETIGAALLASGRRTLRRSPRDESHRGLFCAMGVCFECVVEVNGRTGVRACMTAVVDGMEVRTEPRETQT